jgi:DMSO reductase anchor subunit
VHPEDPHWPLIWLTLVSQLAVGMSITGSAPWHRLVAALLAGAALAGAIFHLGRPAMAWKALRNLRRSWLSREVALLSAYAACAAGAVAVPALSVPTAVAGIAGAYASARLYIVPGRPSWNSPLTVVRFFATVTALGGAVTLRPALAVAGAVTALGAMAINWARLAVSDGHAAHAALRLELDVLGGWTGFRIITGFLGGLAVTLGSPVAAFVLLAVSEALGRWVFFVSAAPLNMPGGFFRGTAAAPR